MSKNIFTQMLCYINGHFIDWNFSLHINLAKIVYDT